MMKQILGTMTFGEQVDDDDAKAMLDTFFAADNHEIDTAYQYCDGRTEEMLGRLLPQRADRQPYVASKVNPWNDEGLQPRQVRKQFDEILQRLGVDSIDLLYLHAPDPDTPVAQTLECCHELYRQGRFRDFGLSNFAAWQVAEVAELCRHNGWMEPRVYQGMYNALTRDVERELFPCLRSYGISFYVYNPLAGGLLTGKYRAIEDLPDSGRFCVKTNYRDRYWKQDYFGVLQQLGDACGEFGITPTQAAMSWLVNHSLLDADQGDGIILGITRLEHLQANMAACKQAPLEPPILDILDRGWEIIKPNCFKYFRP
ncbi:MAG: aldo/keto reductase [Gammaproteobacteria bacterium]|nr:aldo/keto reductase [Gammaproteobacteria bacterium]MDH3449766.1 aldo/keto reductase [Gammaproteobacteria bacterium]